MKCLRKIRRNFKNTRFFETFVKNSFMYSYLWNSRVKYTENFQSEIGTKFTENFENILGQLWGRFSKSIRKFCEKLTKFWVLEHISEKFVGNIWLIFLQFEKFSVFQGLTYYNLGRLKKIFVRLFEKGRKFRKNLRKFKFNFLKIFRKFCVCININSKFSRRVCHFVFLNVP